VSSAVVLIRPLISWSSRRSVRTAQTWPECSAALAVATALPNAANDIGCRIRRSRSATVLIPCVMMPPTLPTTERMASGSVRCSPAMALPSAVTALVGSVSSPKEPDGRQKYPPQRPREWQPSLEPMHTWPPTGPPHRQVREGHLEELQVPQGGLHELRPAPPPQRTARAALPPSLGVG